MIFGTSGCFLEGRRLSFFLLGKAGDIPGFRIPHLNLPGVKLAVVRTSRSHICRLYVRHCRVSNFDLKLRDVGHRIRLKID